MIIWMDQCLCIDNMYKKSALENLQKNINIEY